MNTWQGAIANAVKARGYDGAGMTQEQFCFSQFCKAIEELAEVGSCFGTELDSHTVAWMQKEAAHIAKVYFNHPERMGNITLYKSGIALELADLLITLVMAADAIGIDLESLAVEKAVGDVRRGVRK